ncbi:hypothetical protein CVT24_000065 [Panaeolus cyanescens]|uniref:DUF4218 domain-containing protein n=1 Tax=Panaeolus cyanescens TaxID=181874 RepID=A0A409WSQ9_9AGAR|nr:hypothetical protein CVT24_000065 [Panaeolus cyanescens]
MAKQKRKNNAEPPKRQKSQQKTICNCSVCCGKLVAYATKRRHEAGLGAVELRANVVQSLGKRPPSMSTHSLQPAKKKAAISNDHPAVLTAQSQTANSLDSYNHHPTELEQSRSIDDAAPRVPSPTPQDTTSEARIQEIALNQWRGCLRRQHRSPSVDDDVYFAGDVDPHDGDHLLNMDVDALQGAEEEEEELADIEVDKHPDGVNQEVDDTTFRCAFQREAAAVALSGEVFDEAELLLLRMYALKVEDHLTERTFNRLFKVFPNSGQTTLKLTKKHVRFLSGFQPIQYDCCINSCVCFVGPQYKDLDRCPYEKCREPRYKENGQPRKVFEYIPLIPRLKAQMANPTLAKAMRYRSERESSPQDTEDVFDGTHYKSLLGKMVPSSNPPIPFFSDPRDVALGISTDGFGPFEHRDKTCWPIILFNYNLPPDIRFQKQYCINVGTIPGPKKPWDVDSFLFALMEELVRLEIGIEAFDSLTLTFFDFHCYVILGFGDIPAMSLILHMKGQNGLVPCRLCDIQAIRGASKIHYVPLNRENFRKANPAKYDPAKLPMRTHDDFIRKAKEVDAAVTIAEEDRLSKKYGIKGLPILSNLSSLSIPSSFPYDFMHLIWENLMKNLISFWTSDFKDLDHKQKGYIIKKANWEKIGEETAASRSTIPSSFGAAPPNIATKQSQMTAEMYANWTLFIAPIVLKGRFRNAKYYSHFMELVMLLRLCLSFKITRAMREEIKNGFRKWVLSYEELYYERDPDRLSTCPLTIHALLHIADSIETMGPVWTYWAWPMERHCNKLLPSIRSRRHPYVCISTFVSAVAQLDQIRLKYNLVDALNLDPVKKDAHVYTHALYPGFKLAPTKREETLSKSLKKLIWGALATRYQVKSDIVKRIVKLNTPVLQYGRVTRLNGGDLMYARDLVKQWEDGRDASYVRVSRTVAGHSLNMLKVCMMQYTLLVDRHARSHNRASVFDERNFFGQLLRTFVITVPASKRLKLANPTVVILALIRSVKANKGTDNTFYYKKNGALEVVDLATVQCVVGRVPCPGKEWAIVDRSDVITHDRALKGRSRRGSLVVLNSSLSSTTRCTASRAPVYKLLI